MPEFEVIATFKDKKTGEYKNPGDIVIAEGDRINRLKRAGVIGKPIRKEKTETATQKSNAEQRLKELGGGWYELPDGKKVRGKDEALAELRGD